MALLYKKLRLVFSSVCILLLCFPLMARADFPDRALSIVVPFSPGGGHDFTARLMAAKLTEVLGQQVVVLNKPGANGMIGTQFVTQSVPDGYTMTMSSPAETVISPMIYQDMSYDPTKDLSPVTLVGVTPIALIAHPSFPASSVAELVDYVKKNPGTVSYGTPGIGSAHHLAVDWIARSTGIKMLDVPYKGAAPATADVLANQIPLASVGMAPVTPHWKAGKVKVLAIMNNKRLPWLPDVPVASETKGAEAVDVYQWMGVFVPSGTPPEAIKVLNEAYAKVLHDPAVKKTMIERGVDTVGNTVDEFKQYIKEETSKYNKLVKDSGVKINK